MTKTNQIELLCDNHQIAVGNFPGGIDAARYRLVYRVGKEKQFSSSWHDITVTSDNEEINSCLLIAGAGATGIHSHSAVCVGNRLYVAVGDAICALLIPSLTLEWDTTVDSATCFGVYFLPEYRCLISHGELQISRIDLAGRIKWQAGGRDIFTEGFAIREQFIEATDFYNTTYQIDIETGRIIAELPATSGV